MEGLDFLPPHWSLSDEGDLFINSVTGEKTEEHPLSRFHTMRSRYIVENITNGNGNSSFLESKPISSGGPSRPLSRSGTIEDALNGSGKKDFFDYHCQWSERDSNGKVSKYGLTIRYIEDSQILVKFDGINAEWVYSSLQGPSGPIEQCDLFIGAKVTVFGRHLTISSASSASVQWIEKEAIKMERKIEDYRQRIESMGVTPCVRRAPPAPVRNISRGTRLQGQRDLKLLRGEMVRLGEQLASLGFAHLLT